MKPTSDPRPLPPRLSFHAHETHRGSRVWAFVRGLPRQIIYLGTLSGSGFEYQTAEDGKRREEPRRAYFSATKEDLVRAEVDRKRAEIKEIEAQIALLESLATREGLEEIQQAYEAALDKYEESMEGTPEHMPAFEAKQAAAARINEVLGKRADCMIW